MKTAVEWLIQQIEKDSDIIFYDRNLHPYQEYIEQAKAMEKQQIIEACNVIQNSIELTDDKKGFFVLDGEHYYNETFKKEQ